MRKAPMMFILLAVLAVVATGCGTFVHGFHQELPISTSPAGVMVKIDDQQCTTPCTLNVSRKARTIVVYGPAGEKEYNLGKTVNVGTYYFGNGVTFVIPGLVVDAIAGSKYSIEPVDLILPHSAKKIDIVATPAVTTSSFSRVISE